MKRSTVVSGTAALAVTERGAPTTDNETIVMVHGWPDRSDLWDPVAERLADAASGPGHHVVTFDTRGVGHSLPATVHQPYTLDKLASDIDTVIGATSPDRRVHLVGHDWGGVIGWEYVSTDRCTTKLKSFTTVSGPNLDHTGEAMRSSPQAAVRQGCKSLYTLVLSIPIVRTVLWRLGLAPLFRQWLKLTEGIDPSGGYPGPGLVADAIAAVPLYRSNIPRKVAAPEPRRARVPVHQIVATKDFYVSPSVLACSEQYVDEFTRSEVIAGHWSPRTHPEGVADLIAEGIAAHHNISASQPTLTATDRIPEESTT